jgi:excisionase family DNA binding protein
MIKWLTVEEIARHLRTTPSTIYKLKERGDIRGYRAGRNLLFDVEEVDADIKRRNIGAKKAPGKQDGGPADANQREVS